MLKDLWNRFMGRRDEAAQKHEIERERMTAEERRQDDESFEDRQADLVTEAHLGGIDPERLIADEDPNRH